jgi:hypothetical protein
VTIKRSIVNGSPRIELLGCPPQQLASLKSLGCFTGVIQYRTRVFLPVSTAETILADLLKTA